MFHRYTHPRLRIQWFVFVVLLGMFALSMGAAKTAVAATCQWTGAVNIDWNNAGNWSCAVVPGANDEVVLDNSVISGSYSINLPDGATTTSISRLTITPNSSNNITLNLPAANTGNPGFSVGDNTANTDDIILNNGAILRNSSGVSAGNGIEVNSTSNGTIRINNGGRYIHNTARSTAGIVPRLSVVSGTEQGIFEYDSPGIGNDAISASGRNYGSLVLTRTAGAATYTALGGSSLTIRGDFEINSGVTFNSTMTGNMLVGRNWTQNGAGFSHISTVTFNGSSQQQIGGSTGTNFNNLTIANTASVIIPANTSVTNLLTNNGRLQQTRNITDDSAVTFLGLGGYGGVIMQNNGTHPLGATTVVIRGNQDCTTEPNETVKRCFDITPGAAPTANINVAITFYYSNAELNELNCENMYVWHWDAAIPEWNTVGTEDPVWQCGTEPYSVAIIGVNSFSPFVLYPNPEASPTAVSLQSFSANPNTSVFFVLMVAALMIMGSGTAVILQRRKA